MAGNIDPAFAPICCIDGAPASHDALVSVATTNYGHITIMQSRQGWVRGLAYHLDRLEAANQELFGRSLGRHRVIECLLSVANERPNATLRINIFGGDCYEHVMVTATPPVVPNRRAAQFSLVPFERDMPHLKHAGSFGLALRQRLAIAAGYEGAVFVDREGQISEATIWNVGFFEGESVVWPRARTLRGITQMIIDDGLARLGVPVRYEPVPVDALGLYRSAFLTNSNTFGRPLASIGGHRFEIDPANDALLQRAYELTELKPISV